MGKMGIRYFFEDEMGIKCYVSPPSHNSGLVFIFLKLNFNPFIARFIVNNNDLI